MRTPPATSRPVPPPPPPPPPITLLVGLATLLACQGKLSDASSPQAPPALASRPVAAPQRVTRPTPVPHWTRGGSEHDTIFSYPTSAVADSRRVYVLDRGAKRVIALRATDGQVAWTVGQPTDAPGRAPGRRTVSPAAIAAAHGAGVAVADLEQAAITTFDPDGRPIRATPLTSVSTLRSFCTLPDSSYLLANPTPDAPLAHLPARGGTPRPLSLPWPDLAGSPSLLTQIWLTSSPDATRCAVALVLGRGFALHDGHRSVTHQPYVERFDLPTVIVQRERRDSATIVTRRRLSTDRLAAQDVAFAGRHLAVAFDGDTPHRARLVDLYDARTGRYEASALFPRRITALAANDSALFILYSRRGRPALSSVPIASLLHPSASAAVAAADVRVTAGPTVRRPRPLPPTPAEVHFP